VQGDNARYLVIDGASRPGVLVVTASGNLPREAFYLQHALAAAGPGGAAYRVTGVSTQQLSTWAGPQLAAFAAVLLVSTRGLERSGRVLLDQYVRRGGGLLIAAGPETDGEVASNVLPGLFTIEEAAAPASGSRTTQRVFAPVDLRHPLFRAFGARAASLGLASFDRIATIRGAECQLLARFTTGEAALLECSADDGRVMVLASDLDRQWNDFPRHATFVPFLHEAVRYLAGPRPGTAEYLIGDTPKDVPSRPGIATIPGREGGPPRLVAVNVDPSEAEPGRLTPDEFLAAVTRLQEAAQVQRLVQDRQHEDRQRLWQYVLGMMLVMMVVEAFVAAKTA
jgi:hypothetical protein